MDAFGGGLAGNMAEERAYGMQAMKLKAPTYTERLALALTDAETRAADLKRVKEILDKHPEIEELLTILQRVHV